MPTLYGAKGGSSTTSNLYTVDPATGATTSVGAIGFAITGLAFDPMTGILYGATSSNSSAHPLSLVTINPTTGAGTFVGAFGLASSATCADIACDSAGNMFGWASTANDLCSINKATGAATPIGSHLFSGGGLAFNSGDVLYHIPQSTGGGAQIATINTSTGNRTNVHAVGAGPGGTGGVSATKFDATDVLYGFWNQGSGSPENLVTIAVATGVVTNIGLTDNLMDGIAWSVTGGPAPPEGVSIAFTDAALEPSPTWTRVDV